MAHIGHPTVTDGKYTALRQPSFDLLTSMSFIVKLPSIQARSQDQCRNALVCLLHGLKEAQGYGALLL